MARAGFPDFEADAYVDEVRRRHDYLRARGIAYLTVIVPEKFTIYPSTFRPGCTRARSDAAGAHDRSAGEGWHRAVCRFTAAASRGQEPRDALLFDRFALEPRRRGVGYMAIMRAVQTLLPGRIPSIAPPVRPPYVPGRDVYWGISRKA